MRKIANFFTRTVGAPVVGQLASTENGIVIWTEEHKIEAEAEDSPLKNATAIAPLFGLKYAILLPGDEVYSPADERIGIVKSEKNNTEFVIDYAGVEETVLRKNLYKVLSHDISENQLRPVLKGTLKNNSRIVVAFPNIKVVNNEDFTVSVFVDDDKMEEVKITGDEVADKRAVAHACNKYADPILDENGHLMIDRYKSVKK